MKGTLLHYSSEEKTGVISAESGERYTFIGAEWKEDKVPKKNQKVDFIAEGKVAKEVYLAIGSSEFRADEAVEAVKEQLNELKQSEALSGVMQYLIRVKEKGMQYKFGFWIAFLMLLAYFLPVLEVPFVGNFSLWDGELGKFVVFGLLVLLFLYYAGAKALWIRIVTVIILFMLFLQVYDLFSGLNDVGNSMYMGYRHNSNLFSLLKFGIIVIIPLALLLGLVGIFRREKK